MRRISIQGVIPEHIVEALKEIGLKVTVKEVQSSYGTATTTFSEIEPINENVVFDIDKNRV